MQCGIQRPGDSVTSHKLVTNLWVPVLYWEGSLCWKKSQALRRRRSCGRLVVDSVFLLLWMTLVCCGHMDNLADAVQGESHSIWKIVSIRIIRINKPKPVLRGIAVGIQRTSVTAIHCCTNSGSTVSSKDLKNNGLDKIEACFPTTLVSQRCSCSNPHNLWIC
jgi:hypothetical protein